MSMGAAPCAHGVVTRVISTHGAAGYRIARPTHAWCKPCSIGTVSASIDAWGACIVRSMCKYSDSNCNPRHKKKRVDIGRGDAHAEVRRHPHRCPAHVRTCMHATRQRHAQCHSPASSQVACRYLCMGVMYMYGRATSVLRACVHVCIHALVPPFPRPPPLWYCVRGCMSTTTYSSSHLPETL